MSLGEFSQPCGHQFAVVAHSGQSSETGVIRKVSAGYTAAAWVQPKALNGDSAVGRLNRSGRVILDRSDTAASMAMTTKQNIEGALPLDEEPLKQCQRLLAVVNQQADASVDQIVEVLLDLKFEPVTSSGFIRAFKRDFPAHPETLLPQLEASRVRFVRQCRPES